MKDYILLLDNITNAIKALPKRIAVLGVNFSKERFTQQNWFDSSAKPWQPRSTKRRGGTRRQSGAILVDSGRLKRSIRTISISPNSVLIGTDVPYAQAHNDGFNGKVSIKQHSRHRNGKTYTVKAHSRSVNLPQRRFLGDSQELNNRLENLVINELEKAIRL